MQNPFGRLTDLLQREPRAILVTGLLVLVVGVSFFLRYQSFAQTELSRYPNGDAAKYLLYAYNLKNFGVYGKTDMALLPPNTPRDAAQQSIEPGSLVTPGYPFFVAYFLGGEYTEDQRDNIIRTQVILSVLTVLLTYFVFSPVNPYVGLGAAALTAFSPHLVNMNLFLLTEPLFCFLLVSFIFLLSRLRRESPAPLFLLTGIVFGMATLTRPWVQGYLFLLIPFMMLSTWKIKLSRVALLVLGFAILMSPWLLRNQLTFGFMVDPTLSVASFHHGMYPDMMYDGNPESLGVAYNFDPMAAELGKSSDTTIAELKRRASEEPWTYLRWYTVGKTVSVLSWSMIAAADATFVYVANNTPYFSAPFFYHSSYAMEQVHGLLMILALAATFVVWLPRRSLKVSEDSLLFLRATSLLVLYFLVMHSIGAPYPRYSVPMRPVLYGMALAAILLGWQWARSRLSAGKTQTSVE